MQIVSIQMDECFVSGDFWYCWRNEERFEAIGNVTLLREWVGVGSTP